MTGLVYVLVAASVRFAGTKWIDKLLPPIIIGPMIIVIGLGLAGSAVYKRWSCSGGNWKNALVAVVTFLIAAFINTKEKASYDHSFPLCHYRWLPLRSSSWAS